ncbi:RagB/SusD family nutrient uptake outer membrane protein [Solitalea lacus]|uniref:RagB/SusD family nutrient uptake outer membrane protein n=1 Tax=Solitalea lacus TaxID=2911172 RepID=UPI001EDB8869|nr:RagB/SusD family nutrient uptake outer membrane protein [Solitalea lacus]UKJ06744.1 RagB/SusD family nutrient uptake outer membrane protein [Solitalea lacus]
MKRNYTLISCLFFSLLLSSCEKDVMTQLPVDRTDITDIFSPKDKEGNMINEYVASIYAQLPRGFNRIGSNVLDAATDDAVSASSTTVEVDKFKIGQVSPTDLPENPWASNYAAIRRVNVLLANIDNSGIPQVRKDAIKAEVRFLRAMFYFELVKRWGNVPLVGDKVFAVDDNLSLARNTRQECVNYIVSECDAIKGKVLLTTDATYEIGRISKGAVLALKARLLLYDASPLYNPTNDITKWQAAAAAAKELMDMGAYQLVASASFGTMFTTRNNTEFILAYQQADNTSVESFNEPPGFQRAGKGYTNPTQDLVEAFKMKNGKSITDPTSGYSQAAPATNRDIRFALTIFYNGMSWLSTPLELFDGGKHNLKPGVGSGTKTGYYMRKFMTTTGSAASFTSATHNFPLFRYAEVLLNYAEAQNEALASPDASVYTAINLIRTRAGFTTPLAAGSLTQAQMRDIIRNERRCELAFEEHRFWDIRRWNIAKDVLNGSLRGMKITKDPVTSALTYQIVKVQDVTYDQKMNLYPVPFSEIMRNNQLDQNQGWN